jgi:superfamily I DNA/RNA helicase
MDANELARQRAAQLHFEAVARGLDPWKSYAFAAAEAERREISVESAAPDAVQLDGARAVFIPRDRLILHENVGNSFDQAFLVAHEIGHVELGDDPDRGEDVVEIDPARISEPSPVGIDRVVDYGRKQRREVQMDLFAREFFLPRSVVRKLHIEDGLTASDIAARLGAPFEVVAQQLFDALLLPAVVQAAEPPKKEYPPNELQRTAAAHRGKAYLLEAGPGTGKTQTLALRVESLLAGGVDPRRILVLTFSNKAASEMAERIGRKHKEAAAMWIGTFHAFGLDIVRRFYSELGLPKDPRMMDRTEAAELLENEFPRLGLVHYRNIYDPTQTISNVLAAISRAKDEVIDEARYAALAEEMRRKAKTIEDVEAAERALEVSRIYAAYEKLKRKAACIDFGDLVSLPVRLLETIPSIREHFRNHYEHVLVDEYQDVNRSSIRLLAALRGGGENLWSVGDVKQSIYRFRGASSFNIPRFGNADFIGGERGRLKRNYRSVGEIVEAFSSFAVSMKVGDAEGGLEADRGNSSIRPELRFLAEGDHQTGAVADAIEEMRKAGYSYRDQAVLCTGNEKLSMMALELERVGIPVLFLGSLFERPEVRDMFALLTILTDPRAMGLVRVACWSEFKMPMADVAAVLEHLRESDGKPGEWLSNQEQIFKLSESGQRGVAALSTALAGFDRQSQPWKVLATMLLDRTRIAAQVGASVSIADRTRGIAIWQLMNFIRAQPPSQGLPITRLLDRVRRLLRLGDDRDLRQLPSATQGIDAVRLMTIHGSKGLEFPIIHIPGMNADTIPRTAAAPPCLPPDGMIEGGEGSALEIFRAGQAEEQECLFFVAVSRARDRLLLYAPAKKGGRQSRPSPFLEKLGPGLFQRNIEVQRIVPAAAEAADIELAVEGGLRFNGHQLALYDSCPRRFFYTHVLRVGGRRTVTMFMQMHEAVRVVFQSVVAGEVMTSDEVLGQKVGEEFARQGLVGQGYESDYKVLAMAMLRYFVSTREKHQAEATAALILYFGEEQIIVLPDDVVVRSDGSRVFRRIRTGHSRSTEIEDVSAAAFVLAARQAFPDAVVELVHLADETSTPVSLTRRKLDNRREKLAEFLAAIRQGRFPANPSGYVCPGCPAFFICGPTPSGALLKKF